MAPNLGRKATTTRAVAVAAAVGDDDDGRIHPEGREVAWMDAELLLLFLVGWNRFSISLDLCLCLFFEGYT